VADADEHAGAAARQPFRRQPGVLQGLPGDLEEQALLRVHAGRFARRDAEEAGVELVDGIEKAAPARDHLAGCAGRRVKIGSRIPTIRGHLAHRIHAVAEQGPKGLGIGCTGEPAAQADDRDGCAPSALEFPLQRVVLRLKFLDSQ